MTTTQFTSEIRDGVEVGTIRHAGREYAALGSVVTPESIVAYKKGDTLTTWAGDVLGTCRVTSTWKTPRSYVSDVMHQLEAIVKGIRYTGRCAGDEMIFRGKRAR